jgi:hypothetical protein
VSNLDKARAAWGLPLADWTEALAVACDESSQRQVAANLGYSPGAVNAVINNKWPASTAAIERIVRERLMAVTLICPVQGEIGLNTCLANQALEFASTNHQRVRLYRACRSGCHHSRTRRDGAGN